MPPTDRRRKPFAGLAEKSTQAINFKPLVFDEFQTGVDKHSLCNATSDWVGYYVFTIERLRE
jgi:hypothetical protein